MKKVLFLQIKGNSIGGIWFVYKKLGEKFVNEGYEVEVLNIRNNPGKNNDGINNFKITTINEKDLWEIVHRRDVLNSILKLKFFRTLLKYLKDYIKLRKDYKLAKKYITNYNPDYIVASNCELLKIIPKKYLSHTIFHFHTSLEQLIKNRMLKKTLYKFNNKIHFLWLTKATMKYADKIGLKNNHYIYNPVKFSTSKIANVVKNKKITVISRISYEKRLDLMIDIVDEALRLVDDKSWIFEIYGAGDLSDILKKYNNPRIKHMGVTNDPKALLLNSSINLNTSVYEGFSLSILEAGECGIPSIAFDFGESVFEQIKNNSTGYIATSRSDYVEKLIYLMNNPDELKKMSLNVKEYHKKFNIDNIFLQWEKLFEQIN